MIRNVVVPSVMASALLFSSGVPAAQLFSPDSVDQPLSAKARNAIEVSAGWQRDATSPYRGADGRVIHQYGLGQPEVVCSTSFPCDIALRKGEIFHDVFIGKKSQWNVQATTSGQGRRGHQVHLIIAPRSTAYRGRVALMIFTNERTYHLKVIAREGQGTHAIGFSYPEDASQQLERLRDYQSQFERQDGAAVIDDWRKERTSADVTHGYTVEGMASWKPRAVYEDGRQTYIEFPKGVLASNAPALLVQASNKQYAVTSRRVGDKYVVDAVIEEATLISGGRKVKITKQ